MNPTAKRRTISQRRWTWMSLGLAVIAAAAAMAPAVGGDYVSWDDEDFIARSPFARFGILESFRSILAGEAYGDWAYYPVFRASWFFDSVLFRHNPHLSHLLNLLFHLVNVVLVWLCVRSILARSTAMSHRQILLAAGFAATAFGIHPVNVEPAAWVSGRKVELALLFSLCAFLLLLSPRGGWGRYALAVPVYALGLFSNAVAIGLCLVFGAWWTMAQRVRFWKSALLVLPFLALAFLSGATRLSTRGAEREIVATKESWGDQLGQSLAGRARETLDVVWPKALAPMYPSVGIEGPFWTRDSFAGVLLVAASAAFVVWGWRRGAASAASCPLPALAAFGLAWYWLALAPAFVHHIPQADRHLYCSAIGLFLTLGVLFAAAFERTGPRGKAVLAALCCAAGLILSAASVRQTTRWKNDKRLYSHAVEAVKDNYVAHCNLGNVFFKEDNLQEAMLHYREAIRLRPDYPEAHSNLAAALISLDRLPEALLPLETALRLRPDYAHAWYNLANLRKDLGQTDESAAAYRRVLELTPGDAKVHYELGVLLEGVGQREKAASHLEESLRLRPDYAEARSALESLAASGRAPALP